MPFITIKEKCYSFEHNSLSLAVAKKLLFALNDGYIHSALILSSNRPKLGDVPRQQYIAAAQVVHDNLNEDYLHACPILRNLSIEKLEP